MTGVDQGWWVVWCRKCFLPTGHHDWCAPPWPQHPADNRRGGRDG